MAIVYQHIRKDSNQVFYVGIGNTPKRAHSLSGRNKHWHNIVNRAGYFIEILLKDISIDLAKDYEEFLISFYGRYDKKAGPLVNMTDGGQFSNPNKGKKLGKRSEEVIKKIKDSWTDKRKQSYSEKYSGSNSYWYGKKGLGTPMYGKKQSKKHNDSIKAYMNSNRNPAKDPVIRKIFSEKKLGEKNPKAKKVEQYTKDGYYIKTWNCIIDATRELGIFHIDQVCLGNRKSAGGYIWKYKK
jgi:hypothetical protein